MIQRAFLVLSASACLVACLGKTTSLGSAEGSQSSANSAEDGGDAGTRVPVFPPEEELEEAGSSSSTGNLGPVCHGYSFDPVPGTAACEYLLPPSNPPQNDDPRLDPAQWNTDRVQIYVIIPKDWRYGSYKPSSADCGNSDGWYYLEADGQARTHFAVCPKSCAAIVEQGALLRLSATTYCE